LDDPEKDGLASNEITSREEETDGEESKRRIEDVGDTSGLTFSDL
jgi:hypothetical protein